MPRITGHVRVEPRARGGHVWVAKYMQACGSPTRKTLGPAHVRDSGTHTTRGAIVWHAASGPAPAGHLTPREADDALTELLTIERGRPTHHTSRVAGRTFGDACAAYLDYVEFDKGIAATTLTRYSGIVRAHLLTAFAAGTPLARVDMGRIERYRSTMIEQAALSRSAMRQHLIVLNGILKLAKRRGWIARNPMVDVERIHVPKASGDFNVLEPAQVEAVAQAACTDWATVRPGGRNHTRVSDARAAVLTAQRVQAALTFAQIIRFAAYTGLRLGELRALRWRDINVRDAIVHVRENAPSSGPQDAQPKAPKSQLVRSVPLSAPAQDATERLRARPTHTSPTDYVFPSPTGALIDPGDVRDAFYSALALAGLSDLRDGPRPITFHDLRHTFGTLAVRVFPLSDVQAYMGHADIATTMRYVHHVPRNDAARRLSDAFAVGATDLVAA